MFGGLLDAGIMRFMVVTDDLSSQRLSATIEATPAKRANYTNYKRSMFDLCSQHARKTNWADFVLAMRNKVVRFKEVDQDEWEQLLNSVLGA